MCERAILTSTGKAFDFTLPRHKSICIEDIAHHLALINRYTGATQVPYSVAEHSVRMSYLTVGVPIINLLHDSAEAYLSDIASPIKKGLGWGINESYLSYKDAESNVLKYIGETLGVRCLYLNIKHPKIKEADLIMLATEVRDLMPKGTLDHPIFARWIRDIKPDEQRIYPWPWYVAEAKFITRFKELTYG